jgi:hypothetical protein
MFLYLFVRPLFHLQSREAWLMNWLANLSGCPNRFKEMDLLEEHLNFWAKVRDFFFAYMVRSGS